MGPKTSRLVSQLKELSAVLHELDQDHWARWMTECARRLRQSEFSGITHLLGAYGGMGSVSDILPQLVGETSDPRVTQARHLRSDVWQLADEIRREAEFE